jgi:DNA-binding GntR family transcriptional regulator
VAGTGEDLRDASVSNTEDVYARLRDMLLNGEIPADTIISQVKLARELGVSTTPLREAMRLLQAEGLLIAEHNRRSRVAPLDPADIDAVYASRILLESLAIRINVPLMDRDTLAALRSGLEEMVRAAAADDQAAWEPAHREFHQRLIDGAGPSLLRIIEPLVDRSDRYRRSGMFGARTPLWDVGNDEHEAILQACEARDADGAGANLARHLARSALTVLARIAPEEDPVGIRTALLTTKGSP